MKYLKAYIKDKISAMAYDRKARNIEPEGIIMPDLQREVITDVKAVINELCREGILQYYSTLNSVAFKIKARQE